MKTWKNANKNALSERISPHFDSEYWLCWDLPRSQVWKLVSLIKRMSSTVNVFRQQALSASRLIWRTGLTLIGMSSENKKKCSSLALPRSTFCKTQWPWQGVKLTRLVSIFTSKKVWNFLIKNQMTKSDKKRQGGGKCPALWQLGLNQFWGHLGRATSHLHMIDFFTDQQGRNQMY